MRIALVASPFISVPPLHYGGTELFIAQLALGLKDRGFDVVVYANGESQLDAEIRWLYAKGEWPIEGELYENLKDVNHNAWAVCDALNDADIIHLNNVPGIAFTRFGGPEFVYTIHHPHREELSEFYSYYPHVQYVSISHFQQSRERMPRLKTIHHGIEPTAYTLNEQKQEYLCFLGRIAPLKGTHIAIEVAKRCGMPLKIAGEVQPMFREYFETEIKPHVDGDFIEYVGVADLQTKNKLLGNAAAMLFPIQWDEPFGLVMIEAMATGTPVIAFPGGAVSEIIRDGISGKICHSIDEMSQCVREVPDMFSPAALRAYVTEVFSVDRMVDDYAALYLELATKKTAERAPQAAPSIETTLVNSNHKLMEITKDEFTDDPEEPRAVA